MPVRLFRGNDGFMMPENTTGKKSWMQDAATRVPGSSLIADIQFILGGPAACVIDVGCQHGDTSLDYLKVFPNSRLFGFEAEASNFARTQATLAPYGDRVHLYCKAVTDRTGAVALHVNSHDGTHSLFEIGEQRYWAGPAAELETRLVSGICLDDVFSDDGGGLIDLLHMDIQGGELRALRGAERLLRARRIRLVYIEVCFYPLYKGQPLFWELGQFLSEHGFRFYSLYDRYYHVSNPRVLSWSDALFICDELAQVGNRANSAG